LKIVEEELEKWIYSYLKKRKTDGKNETEKRVCAFIEKSAAGFASSIKHH
jgi:hypothetical protein